MSSAVAALPTTQRHRIWIKATPEQVWHALTDPATLAGYGYGGRVESEFVPGAAYLAKASPEMLAMGGPEVMLDGEIIEAEAPRRLAHTWHAVWDEAISAEPASIVTYDIEPGLHGVTKLTVTHDCAGAPITAGITSGTVADAGGGWGWILSDLKTLLESGEPLPVQMFG